MKYEYLTLERWEPFFEARGGEQKFGNYSLPDYRFKRLISEANIVVEENKLLTDCVVDMKRIMFWLSERDNYNADDFHAAFQDMVNTTLIKHKEIIEEIK